jgi:transposase
MTQAWSRRQYLQFVWDQTVATWLAYHRRAVEWFAAVPQRLAIDNPKCAITRTCIHNPLV